MSAPLTCLIIDKMHASIVPMMENIGYHVDYCPEMGRRELIQKIGDYNSLIFRSKTNIDKEVFDKARMLKLVARAGAGLDLVDMDELKKRNILLINAPEGNRDALAEHAMGMLLCLLNKILIADSEIRNGIWDREGNRGVELKGKTVALIGYGFMGRALAKRLASFGCKTLAYNNYINSFYNDLVSITSLEEIYENADIVSIHVPLNNETINMIDENFFNSFKKSIYFMNTSRGEVVKLSSIKAGLTSGKILGAALDVLENEKFDTLTEEQKEVMGFLTKSDKVLFTPHVAGWSHESYIKINEVLVEKIKRLDLKS